MAEGVEFLHALAQALAAVALYPPRHALGNVPSITHFNGC